MAFFLKQIEESDEDVVKEYLSESTGEELISLLETGFDRKSNELAVIFKVLAIIIIRTRKDLSDVYGEVGRRLAEGLLEDAPLSSCFRALKPHSSAEATKASLQLLSAVVSADPLFLGRSLLRSVNFEHPDWIQVARRRNTKDAIDVRTCFINFIASFLFSGNNLLIRELLEAKSELSFLILKCRQRINCLFYLNDYFELLFYYGFEFEFHSFRRDQLDSIFCSHYFRFRLSYLLYSRDWLFKASVSEFLESKFNGFQKGELGGSLHFFARIINAKTT